jgi:cytosine permease
MISFTCVNITFFPNTLKRKFILGGNFMEKAQRLIDTLEDYQDERIPYEKKVGSLHLFNMWLGWAIWPGALLAGAAIGGGMGFYRALAAVTVGSFILFVIHLLMGRVGYKEGLLTVIINVRSWGTSGRKIPGVFYGLGLFGWYAVIVGFAGDSFYHSFPVIGAWFWIIIFGLLYAISAIYGFKGMSIIASIGSPIILIISVWGLYYAVNTVGGVQALVDVQPKNEIGFWRAVTLTIASWIVASSMCIDTYRFAKNKIAVASGALGGMVIGNGLTILVGVALALGANETDLVVIMNKLGLGIPATLFLILGVWTSAQMNVYISSLNISAVTGWKRFYTSWGCAIIGTILAVTGLYSSYVGFLDLMTLVYGGFIGITLADAYLARGQRFDLSLKSYRKFVPSALIAWIISIFVEISISKNGIGIPNINGLVAALIVYLLVAALLKDHPSFKLKPTN